ncbi:MAG: HAMP domain-containing protein [Deltaproteobacteria bacterium]|nr:HAMP domain-containing protein [Deltaproteobacteria bacterium]MCW5807050.1 HAMP domain-containing protein [Deltaproteobacteria bacterium]
MKVATRITVATAVVVAIAATLYATSSVGSRAEERRNDIEREARSLVGSLRVVLEGMAARDGLDQARIRRELEEITKRIADAESEHASLREVSPVELGYRLIQQARSQATANLDKLREMKGEIEKGLAQARAAATFPPSEATLQRLAGASGWQVLVVAPGQLVGATEAQRHRLDMMLAVPAVPGSRIPSFADNDGDAYFHAVPLRSGGALDEERRPVMAMLEVWRPFEDGTSGERRRAVLLVVVIVALTTIVVGVLANRLVSRPITKLLTGVDDVAKGDLSHVILSERDDEIGAIATRFNEMTYSLRESRGETLRQNEAKLALEQRLGQTEKLATIGQLAAEIAHEVGTPLNVIAGRARSIQRKSRDPEAVEKNAGIVAEQTARITRIIQRLLDFTRRKVGHAERAQVNVNEIAFTTMELLNGQFTAAKVRHRLDRAEGLPPVAGDADRLQQVMINLILNAVQAMPDGGNLTVETSLVRRTRPGLEDGREQDFVSIAVTDSGVGIPAEIRDRIFDPFYTTKEGTGGTGLGLAVCTGIVKEHDGWIDVEDASGGGTMFRVNIPT